MERCEIVYRLDADEFSGEVNAREIGSIIYSFADVVQETMREIGADDQLTVSVKPFEKGSFLMDFVVDYGGMVATLFASQEAGALSNALTILGFIGKSAKSLPEVIRAVRGDIADCHDNGDGTYTYGSGEDALTVDERVHKVIQSQRVARSYRDAVIRPIINIDKSVHISVQDRGAYIAGDYSSGSRFDRGDVPDFDTYESVAAELADVDEAVEGTYTIDRAVLNPSSGSYSGNEKGYAFTLNGETIRGVKIECPWFLQQLRDNAVRFAGRDTLIAKLAYDQVVSDGKPKRKNWRIVEVIDYIPYEPPRQITMEEFLEQSE